MSKLINSEFMNIDSRMLVSCPIPSSIKVGDLVHSKGARITNWGRTWIVEKVLPTRIHVVAHSSWFPVFEETAFGRIANGENKNMVDWMLENMSSQKGELKATFWQDGTKMGSPNIRTVCKRDILNS